MVEPGDAASTADSTLFRSPLQLFWRRLRRNRVTLLAGIGVILLVLLAVAAPLFVRFVSHHPPNHLNYGSGLDPDPDKYGTPLGPSRAFWLGADNDGRDVFIRILYGARVSLLIAVVSTALVLVIGTGVGLVAGYFRGWVDTVLSRVLDFLLAFPLLLLGLGVGAACKERSGCLGGALRPGLPLLVFIIVMAFWPYLARLVRGQVLSLREQEFVEAARMAGSSDARIVFTEVLPNLVGPVLVAATLMLPEAIGLEAGLSFLGVGLHEPNASWGRMISESVGTFQTAWWYFAFPGLFLLGTILAFNLLGDGLADAQEPGRSRSILRDR